MPFDRATFYASARKSTLFDGTLSRRQVAGTEAILDAWDKSGLTDERWLAYMLATTYHETGRAMYPVPEGGRGKGHPYGVLNEHGQVGYGRGYVQITWNGPAPKPDNYARADKALGLDGTLIADNDRALEPVIAAQILIRGMTEAWFTRFRLADYINDHLADYLHARRIVNGMDQADKIAGYALIFFAAIQAAERKAADHSAVVDAKPPMPPVDPISDAIGQVGKAITDVVDPAPQPTAAPSPVPSASQPATKDTEDMNPISGMLVAARTFQTVLPIVLKAGTAIVHNLPDIEKQAGILVTSLEKAWDEAKHLDINSAAEDLGAAWKAGMQIFEDVGISRELVTQVNASAATDIPALSGLENVIGLAGKITQQLGLQAKAA